jgi:hypothetical protein
MLLKFPSRLIASQKAIINLSIFLSFSSYFFTLFPKLAEHTLLNTLQELSACANLITLSKWIH